MKKIHYTHPPITEVILQFVLSVPVDRKKMEKAAKQLALKYDDYRHGFEEKFEVDVSKSEIKKSEKRPFDEFRSNDLSQQLLIKEKSFTLIQLAPYCGWDHLITRFRRDWGIWSEVVGFQQVERVGLRYVNRVDVPLEGDIYLNEQYVSVCPNVPESLGLANRHAINMSFPLKDLESVLILNTSVVDSPIVKHIAIMLDLDIVKQFKEPIAHEKVFEFVEKARHKKNEVFESCITDKARELFSP